jgi:hypothetical protein
MTQYRTHDTLQNTWHTTEHMTHYRTLNTHYRTFTQKPSWKSLIPQSKLIWPEIPPKALKLLCFHLSLNKSPQNYPYASITRTCNPEQHCTAKAIASRSLPDMNWLKFVQTSSIKTDQAFTQSILHHNLRLGPMSPYPGHIITFQPLSWSLAPSKFGININPWNFSTYPRYLLQQ